MFEVETAYTNCPAILNDRVEHALEQDALVNFLAECEYKMNGHVALAASAYTSECWIARVTLKRDGVVIATDCMRSTSMRGSLAYRE